MASDQKQTSDDSQPTQREPLSPAKQKRLQALFSHGSKQMSQENYDYATELFQQCVVGDPSNLSYVQSYIGNLQKKYNNNKKGANLAQFQQRGARSAQKKALSQERWDDVIANGLKVLTVNPWDVHTLRLMATASDNAGDDEVEMYYLHCALQAAPKDPDVNRQCALALAAREQFDQAIACWHRVEQAKPDDEEAKRAIASLAVEKTIKKAEYGDASSSKIHGNAQAQPQTPQRQLSAEEKLEKQIAADPYELTNYYELAQHHLANENYKAAEEVFSRALEVSDGDPDVRDKWDDAQLRRLRKEITDAADDPAREKQLRKEYFKKQLEVHKNRVERYPNNLAFKYDLGVSYQLNREPHEAIKQFQQARNDPRRKGLCMLALGQCFQQIKQYRLGMSHYESAVEEIPDRDAKNKKEALRLAAKLALALRDVGKAEKHATHLAELDFTYKDIAEILDAIAKLQENKEDDEAPPAED